MQTENKRDRILDTAMLLFARNGYGSTPISRIAKEAGVAQGLMYNYFGSKEELLQGILEKGFSQIRESLQPYLSPGQPKEKVRQHIELSLKMVQANADFWRLVNCLRMQPDLLAKLGPETMEMNAYIIRTLTDHFQELNYPFPEMEAMLLFAVFDGMVNLYLTIGDEFPVDRLKEFLLSKYHITKLRL